MYWKIIIRVSKKLSFVVPVYFEEAVVSRFILEVTQEMEQLKMDYEIVFIDDGSTDKTCQIIKTEANKNPRIKLIELSTELLSIIPIELTLSLSVVATSYPIPPAPPVINILLLLLIICFK